MTLTFRFFCASSLLPLSIAAFFSRVGGGTFINPADYDDRSNLIYSNLAVDGGFEALSTDLEGRFLDSLAILNVNTFLGNYLLLCNGRITPNNNLHSRRIPALHLAQFSTYLNIVGQARCVAL